MFRVLLITFLIISSAFSSNQNNHIKICHLEWGKHGGEKLPEKGFNPDLVTTALKIAGYTTSVKIMPWKRCLLHVQKGSYDMVAGLWIDEEKKKKFHFLESATYDKIAFMSLKTLKLKSGNLEDFKGKRIGILSGAGAMDMVKNGDFIISELINDDLMIRHLKAGRVDAIVSNTDHLLSVIENRFPKLINKIKIWDPAIQVNIVAPAISKNHPKKEELSKRFNKAMRQLKKEGFYEKLFEKHGMKIGYALDKKDFN